MYKLLVIIAGLLLGTLTNAQTLNTITTNGNVSNSAIRLTGENNVGTTGSGELVLGVLTTQKINDTRSFIGWKNDAATNPTTNGQAGTLLLQARSDLANMPIDFVTGLGTPQLRMRIAGNGNIAIGNNTSIPTSRLMITGAGNTNASTTFLLQNSANTDMVKVLDNGYMGIGTTATINEKLHIQNGNLLISSANGTLNTPMGAIKIAWSSTPAAYAGLAGITNSGGLDQLDLAFYTAFGVASEKMRIMSNSGFVGIGTSTPQAKLDVSGNIYCSSKLYIGTPDATTTSKISNYSLAVNGNAIFNKAKVMLYGTPWADFVFDETYTLMPLDELVKFIKLNKHLPQVPSAAEIEKEGIDLGSNQSVLLQKVEELTLYTIEQNKKSAEQQLQINKLLQEVAELKELVKKKNP